MISNSNLTREDYLTFLKYLNKSTSNDEQYLISCYFGSGPDYFHNVIKRAYRDFNRTLHGFGKLSLRDTIRETAANYLNQAFLELRRYEGSVSSQLVFNAWHKQTCFQLVSIYQKNNFHFYIGQAQKWINMTFKYIYTMGESRIYGFGKFYSFCHVPLDNILILQLLRLSFPKISSSWSRIDNYDEYLSRQDWIRNKFPLSPLDIEFNLWLEESLKPKKLARSNSKKS